jgi:hypothetical protein
MKLDGNALRAKQEEFRDVTCIVIDEYACTSQEMLAWINSRCRQFKVYNELFGGLIAQTTLELRSSRSLRGRPGFRLSQARFQASRTGYPIRLAYAMTIHKSQLELLGMIWVDIAIQGPIPDC